MRDDKVKARFYDGPEERQSFTSHVPFPLLVRVPVTTLDPEQGAIYSFDDIPVQDVLKVQPVRVQDKWYRLREYGVHAPLLEQRYARVYVREGVDWESNRIIRAVVRDFRWPTDDGVEVHEPRSIGAT
jgi:hypothetical protein